MLESSTSSKLSLWILQECNKSYGTYRKLPKYTEIYTKSYG